MNDNENQKLTSTFLVWRQNKYNKMNLNEMRYQAGVCD